MIDRAKWKFRESIESGKVSIECADVRQLAFDRNTFDKIYTVNTIEHRDRDERLDSVMVTAYA